MKNMFKVTPVLPHNLLQTNPYIRHNFSTICFCIKQHNFHFLIYSQPPVVAILQTGDIYRIFH